MINTMKTIGTMVAKFSMLVSILIFWLGSGSVIFLIKIYYQSRFIKNSIDNCHVCWAIAQPSKQPEQAREIGRLKMIGRLTVAFCLL